MSPERSHPTSVPRRTSAIWRGRFPATADQVAVARRAVSTELFGYSELDDVVLIVSELATNAIRHSRSGQGGLFEVILRDLDSAVRIEVRDEGKDGLQPLQPLPGTDEALAESHRGLEIVQLLADRWGCIREESHTVVWCDVRSAVGRGVA
ncbi:MAG TPA: ATP-binding protein [Actinocrinis sp.]|uniref:ATP-binding protein n=1 Tax=Actinocrinis sp. TaxID=1920516 RepID=UPI002DDCDCA6|nr:ATP-binding protein [Actinocrinis sp.]HEV3170668.1 ATP-binding protein [Actinocrinis sp.]